MFKKIITFCFFCSSLIFGGCSSDNIEQTSSTNNDKLTTHAKVTNPKIAYARAYWESIQASDAFKNHENASKNFASKLRGQHISLLTLQIKSKFIYWITPRIAQTSWNSVSDAVKEYDNLNALGDTLNIYIKEFLSSIAEANKSDLEEIFNNTLIQINTSSNPCQEGCYLAYNDEMTQNNQSYTVEIANATIARDFASIPSIRAYWECMVAETTNARDTCLSLCS